MAGGEGDDPEPVRMGGQDVDGLAADRAGRAEQRDPEYAAIDRRLR